MIVQSKLTIVEVMINARISDNTTGRMFNQFSWMEMEEVIEAAMQRHCFDKCFEFNLIQHQQLYQQAHINVQDSSCDSEAHQNITRKTLEQSRIRRVCLNLQLRLVLQQLVS